jgi:protein associated with RNAse G/E
MSNEEILQFVNAFEDFMKHAEVEESNFHQHSEYEHYRKESKVIIENEIEKLAAFYEVTVDYFMEEFM